MDMGSKDNKNPSPTTNGGGGVIVMNYRALRVSTHKKLKFTLVKIKGKFVPVL
jgi:hypothetical protein